MDSVSLWIFSLLAFTLSVRSQTTSYATESSGDASAVTTYASSTTTYALSDSGSASTTGYTSDTTGSVYAAASTSTALSSTELPAIQTKQFTGQALLVGTCALPQFTILTFPDGGSIEVPLIGCSDDRPDCCPSLDYSEVEPQESGVETESGDNDQSTSSSSGLTPATTATATGVISMLNRWPLTVCPSDMVDLDPVCCPVGFSHYGQSIIGNLPCFSTLTTTIYTPDSSVLESITSVISASMASATTTTTPTISVIVNQIFALGLPCADEDEEEEHSGLSTGAKAGIGAGAGVGALLLLLALVACCMGYRRRRRNKDSHAPTPGTSQPDAAIANSPFVTSATTVPDPKHLSAATTMRTASPETYSPQPQQQPQQYFHHPGPGLGGYSQPHGYGPAFGYGQVQDQYGGVYNLQPTAMGTALPMTQQYNPMVPNQLNPYPPSQPPLQFYPYPYPQQQQTRPIYPADQRQMSAHHMTIPVEADSGDSITAVGSANTPTIKGSHGSTSANDQSSQPTGSVATGSGGARLSNSNSSTAVAELSTHASSHHQNRPPFIARPLNG